MKKDFSFKSSSASVQVRRNTAKISVVGVVLWGCIPHYFATTAVGAKMRRSMPNSLTKITKRLFKFLKFYTIQPGCRGWAYGGAFRTISQPPAIGANMRRIMPNGLPKITKRLCI